MICRSVSPTRLTPPRAAPPVPVPGGPRRPADSRHRRPLSPPRWFVPVRGALLAFSTLRPPAGWALPGPHPSRRPRGFVPPSAPSLAFSASPLTNQAQR